jgi:hypothetical protein
LFPFNPDRVLAEIPKPPAPAPAELIIPNMESILESLQQVLATRMDPENVVQML